MKFSRLAAALCLLPFALFAADKPWRTLTNCTLKANASNDGDSFHVLHAGEEMIVRLYFVDAPETANDFPERVQAQADYFSITPADALKVGKEAETFTRKELSRPFVILTRAQGAGGRSALGREYATVTPAGGTDLAECLVSNGLARIHGVPVAGIGAEIVAKLQKAEDAAKKARRGAWAHSKGKP